MRYYLKNLWLAVSLIVIASSILLISDLEQRESGRKNRNRDLPRIAIMQIASTPILDDHVEGIIDKLKESEYCNESQDNIRLFNPQGDLTTANTIAKEIVNGAYDIVFTSSTLALQTFSKANLNGDRIHVFGAVTDPYGSGVGIRGENPDQHPPYMAGIGTFQPVEKAFRIALDMNPDIKRIGVVWNPGEHCSEACTLIARKISKEMGITLIEAVATNTSEVSDAIRSVLSQGVDAVWIGGDTVANSAAELIISVAAQSDVPVFTNAPVDTEKGALFGLGANYYTVGLYTGEVGVEILKGKKPSDFRIENIVPQKLIINKDVLKKHSQNWKPGTLSNQMLDADWFNQSSLKPLKDKNIVLINLIENLTLENAIRGIEEGLAQGGLIKDKNYQLTQLCAQGEIAQLPQLFQTAIQKQPDLIITVTTPAFVAGASIVKDIPLVFSVASDPKALKVFKGKTPENICGVHDDPQIARLLEMAMNHDSSLKKIGVLFDAAQANSLISVNKLRKACKKQDIELLESTVTSISDLPMATSALIQRGAQAFIFSADNLISSGFKVIYKVARDQDIPIFVTDMDLIKQGANGGIGDDYFEWGKQSGEMAAKVLLGVAPSELGILPTKNQMIVHPGESYTNSEKNEAYDLRIVLYSETEFAEHCQRGLIDGINQAGFQPNIDYSLKTYNAQGDMSTLSSIMNTVKSARVDLLMVVSTPTLQAAIRQAGSDTKIVFTGVGDGVKAGAGKTEQDHLPTVTGISTRSPFKGMARLIRQMMPDVKHVGTLFTPAEINSVLYKDWFKEALKQEGIELVAVPVTSGAEVAQTAIQLCQEDIQLVAQIVDNLTRPGFALIARKAADKGIPVFAFDSDQMKEGAAICLARDYYDAGLEAAEKAIRVLKGEHPGDIPFNNTQSEKMFYNPDLLAKYKLKVPKEYATKAVKFEK